MTPEQYNYLALVLNQLKDMIRPLGFMEAFDLGLTVLFNVIIIVLLVMIYKKVSEKNTEKDES